MNFEQWWRINLDKVKKDVADPKRASELKAFHSYQYCFYEGRASGFDEVMNQREKIGNSTSKGEGVAEWRQEEADTDFEKEAQDLPRIDPLDEVIFGQEIQLNKHAEEETAEDGWQKFLIGVVYMSELFKDGTFVHMTNGEKKTGVVVGKVKEGWYKIKISATDEVEIVHESRLFIKAGAWSDLTTRREI